MGGGYHPLYFGVDSGLAHGALGGVLTTIAALLDRVSLYLQDDMHEAWPLEHKEAQLREAIQMLGRQQLLGEVSWRQVLASEPEYTFGPETVDFSEVLYSGRSLRPVQEDALTRLRRDWDRAEGLPQYYTTPLEPSETIRLIPVPHTSGSALEYVPPQTIAGAVEGNLVAFTWVTPEEVTAGEFPLQEVLEDVVVFLTVGALSAQDGEWHDKERGQSFSTLAKMLLQELLGGTA
jgi:hypothetical protein